MNSKTYAVIAVVFVTIILIGGSCSAGFVAGRFLQPGDIALSLPGLPAKDATAQPPKADTAQLPQTANQGNTPEELDQLFEPFWQSWEVVHEQFVDQPVDDTTLMRGAIQGMLKSLGDEHTSYLDPDMMERFDAQLNGEEYEGIGAWVDTGGEYLTVISPIPGSPAEKAGLKHDDQIIAIDGEDMTGVDPELARQRVIGPKNSTVVLSIRRPGIEDPFDVTIQRASITIPTVEGRMLEGKNIAYVRLYTFGDDTIRELKKTLKKLLAEKPDGLIFDLRNNGGGYLTTAIDVVSEFIGEGIVMYEEYGDGTLKPYEAQSGGLATDIPMVVLVNEGSASASEIVAGAIQDRQRAPLVGVTSYGKGSVQTPVRLVNDQGQIRVTIARWLTPTKRQINKIGLEPNYVIELSEEDVQADRDPQLDKAIEVIESTGSGGGRQPDKAVQFD